MVDDNQNKDLVTSSFPHIDYTVGVLIPRYREAGLVFPTAEEIASLRADTRQNLLKYTTFISEYVSPRVSESEYALMERRNNERYTDIGISAVMDKLAEGSDIDLVMLYFTYNLGFKRSRLIIDRYKDYHLAVKESFKTNPNYLPVNIKDKLALELGLGAVYLRRDDISHLDNALNEAKAELELPIGEELFGGFFLKKPDTSLVQPVEAKVLYINRR